MFVCDFCGNQDAKKIGLRNGEFYCRNCVTFIGKAARPVVREAQKILPKYSYPLTDEQQRVAHQIVQAIKQKRPVLLHAVCGAGKTELVVEAMAYVLSSGGQVGFAIPRRDVVIDLLPRLQNFFPTRTVQAVYGGHTKVIEADILLLTTHQLYRYEHYFDLLILDELDAFPFHGSPTLLHFFYRSIKGNFIWMSATPSEERKQDILKRKGEILQLFKRYHQQPLPVPRVHATFFPFLFLIRFLVSFKKRHLPCFVFVPTIEVAERLFGYLRYFFSLIHVVHSKKENRNAIIEDFKQGKLKILVTTSVLERGVTVKNLQVIIYQSDHLLYHKEALVQMAGRVGRKIDAPTGEVIFLAAYHSEPMKNAIEEIKGANRWFTSVASA